MSLIISAGVAIRNHMRHRRFCSRVPIRVATKEMHSHKVSSFALRPHESVKLVCLRLGGSTLKRYTYQRTLYPAMWKCSFT